MSYIARERRQFGDIVIEAGDEIPDSLLERVDIDSWVRQGHFIKLEAGETNSMRSLRSKRDVARSALADAENGYSEKLDEMRDKSIGAQVTTIDTQGS
jgi:hypothetical protein